MKVTVKDYLNERIGSPSVNAPTSRYINPGNELEIDGFFYPGDAVEGNNKWVTNGSGKYYWSGAVVSVNGKIELIEPARILVDYNKLLKTPNGLPQSNGSGVNIALLDSGVNSSHKDLKGVVQGSFDFISDKLETKDVYGHGTMMAGFIAGRANVTGIRGVAPLCNLYDFKVIDDAGNTDMNALKKALVHISRNQQDLKIKAVNLSLSVSNLDFVKVELAAVVGLGIKVVVAAGANSSFKYGVRLLARVPNTIGIGAINDPSFLPILPRGLTGFFCNRELYSCSSNQSKLYESGNGDSVYTALTTGLVALALSSELGDLSQYFVDRDQFNQTDISVYN